MRASHEARFSCRAASANTWSARPESCLATLRDGHGSGARSSLVHSTEECAVNGVEVVCREGEARLVEAMAMAMAVAPAMATGSLVDLRYGVVRGGGVRRARGFAPSIAAFPRGVGSFKVNLKCTVRASKNGGPEFDDKNKNEGDKGQVDWDKAWESFPKPKKRNPFNLLSLFNLDMEQYVNRRPTHSNFPLSEETDPMRKTERQALNAWTDSKFTLAGLGVVVGLFVYMVVVVGPPPS